MRYQPFHPDIKKVGRRVMAFLLAIILCLGLGVQAFAAEVSGETDNSGIIVGDDYNDEFGYLELEVAPLVGTDKHPSTWYTSSFLATILYKRDGTLNADKTCYGFAINATYHATSGGDKKVQIHYNIGRDDIENAPALGSGAGSATGQISITPSQDFPDTMYYIYAIAYNADGTIYSQTKMSVNVKVLYEKISAISYSRVGMQVRAVDNTPIGPYDLLKDDATPVANSTGILKGGLGGSYTGMDGKAYDNSYFDIILNDDQMASTGIANLEELYNWLTTVYIPNANAPIGDSVNVIGPAYCIAKNGPQGNIIYNMAYYDPDSSAGINSYASWAETTRYKALPTMRKNSLLIPIKAVGTVTVYCYDEDDPNGEPLDKFTLTSDTFARTNSYEQYLANTLIPATQASVIQAFSDGSDAKESLGVDMSQDLQNMPFEQIKKALTTFEYDKEIKKLIRVNLDSETVYNALQAIGSRAMMTLEQDQKESATAYADFVNVEAPDIEGYEFDFGWGNDALTAFGWGSALFMADDPEADMVVTQAVPSSVVYLYYKGAGETTYTVKVRNNGVIDESLTREYPTVVGEVIEEDMVDTSVVPPDWTIKDIENVPLTVVKDPTKNIIIIDCESEQAYYTIMYYKDGVYVEQDIIEADIGSVISNPPIKGYPGYKLQRIDGTPLTIVDSSGVIRVYYVKAETPAAASVNAKLFKDKFKDEYRTVITKSKSGYGVYGLFYVDVSDLVEAREYPAWTVNGGCSPSAQSKTEKKYINIDIKAWATYKEGLPLTEANKNGTQVNKIALEKDTARSTEKVWVFHFPANQKSAQRLDKFYIPINWKNGTNWTIQFDATVTYDEYKWTTTSASTKCAGHKHTGSYTDSNGKTHSYTYYTYHEYTIHPLQEWYEDGSVKKNGSASIMVNGSMYEDDFTGGRQ